MDVVAAVAGLIVLVVLLYLTSRRWGPPRLYLRGVAALRAVAAILALIILWLVVE